MPQTLRDECVQARQYHVDDGAELFIKIDPADKVMKLYDAEDQDIPMEESGLKNYPQKNFLVGHYGASDRFREFREFIMRLEIGIEVAGFGLNFSAKK